MKTTTKDIARIINGERIKIEVEYPLDDKNKEDGAKPTWYIIQPTDWLYDMAQAIRDAAVAEVMTMPEIERIKKLPPTSSWAQRQREAIETTKKRIAELEKKEKKKTIQPEEDLELANLRDQLDRIVDPDTTRSRADEIASDTGAKAFERYLIQRTVVFEDGELVFDPETDEGEARWENVGRMVRQMLRPSLYEAIMLVHKAKNSESGLSST